MEVDSEEIPSPTLPIESEIVVEVEVEVEEEEEEVVKKLDTKGKSKQPNELTSLALDALPWVEKFRPVTLG